MNEPKRASGKVVAILMVLTILTGAGIWVAIESRMPVLDKKEGKRIASVYEKRCMTELPQQKCREIVAARHTECLLACAEKRDGGVHYDIEKYVTCVDRPNAP